MGFFSQIYLVNKTEISASKKRGSGWDRSRVRGYFKKKSKIVGTHDENMPDMIPIKTIQSSTK